MLSVTGAIFDMKEMAILFGVNQTCLRFSLFTLDILTQCHAVLQPMIEIVENIHYSHS